MAQRQESPIADDLLTYKSCSDAGDPHWMIAGYMELSEGRISQFSSYWKAVSNPGCGVSRNLHRVILLHNGPKQSYCADPLSFDKVYELLRIRQVGRGYARRGIAESHNPAEQDSALEAALGKPVEEATDEELLRIRYSTFLNELTR